MRCLPRVPDELAAAAAAAAILTLATLAPGTAVRAACRPRRCGPGSRGRGRR
jgi:hypothetical protein